jgi:predicted nucleic acid-binding protein
VIIVDTSVWVDHLKTGEPELTSLLNAGKVYGHALVVAEVALGSLRSRDLVLNLLDDLPQATIASTEEVRTFIEMQSLFSRGIGYVDVCLLASCRLRGGTKIWTRDKRLARVAFDLNLEYAPSQH